ncbi:hypothetical protein HYQ46_007187 [Verticillium longisporum]|nr:hypothetical protein HYQ46_007187 [Verticillium longisporum]
MNPLNVGGSYRIAYRAVSHETQSRCDVLAELKARKDHAARKVVDDMRRSQWIQLRPCEVRVPVGRRVKQSSEVGEESERHNGHAAIL